jgi:hypothetical protein
MLICLGRIKASMYRCLEGQVMLICLGRMIFKHHTRLLHWLMAIKYQIRFLLGAGVGAWMAHVDQEQPPISRAPAHAGVDQGWQLPLNCRAGLTRDGSVEYTHLIQNNKQR